LKKSLLKKFENQHNCTSSYYQARRWPYSERWRTSHVLLSNAAGNSKTNSLNRLDSRKVYDNLIYFLGSSSGAPPLMSTHSWGSGFHMMATLSRSCPPPLLVANIAAFVATSTGTSLTSGPARTASPSCPRPPPWWTSGSGSAKKCRQDRVVGARPPINSFTIINFCCEFDVKRALLPTW
jgi:hypothetical protein